MRNRNHKQEEVRIKIHQRNKITTLMKISSRKCLVVGEEPVFLGERLFGIETRVLMNFVF